MEGDPDADAVTFLPIRELHDLFERPTASSAREAHSFTEQVSSSGPTIE